MKYILLNQGEVVHVIDESPYTGTPVMKEFIVDGVKITYDEAKRASGADMDSFEEATKIAEQVSKLLVGHWVPFDDGECTSHRFGIIEVPKVGEDVSYGFNGDYYPCGKIVRVTPSLRVIAEDERGNKTTFNRRQQTACWKKVGGTWSLVKGIHKEQNPHF